MSMYLGDFAEDSLVYFCWTTNDKNGAAITRATDGEIRVYKDDNAVQSTAGITVPRTLIVLQEFTAVK